MDNESRIAEREARKWALTGEIISTQSAREIASWYHGGQCSRAYSFCSTGVVQPDLSREDFVTDWEYDSLSEDKALLWPLDALMAYIEAEKALRHVDYPHPYGYLMGCAECEATCHCEEGRAPCVYCENQDCECEEDGSYFCYSHQVAIAEFSRD